jgi:hypothetical protein
MSNHVVSPSAQKSAFADENMPAGGLPACDAMTGSSINFGIDPQTGQLGPMLTRNVDILHWGFALEFSTLYLTNDRRRSLTSRSLASCLCQAKPKRRGNRVAISVGP